MRKRQFFSKILIVAVLSAFLIAQNASASADTEEISVQGDWLEVGNEDSTLTAIFSFSDYGTYCYWHLFKKYDRPFYEMFPGTYTIEGDEIHLNDKSGGLAVKTLTIVQEADGVHLYSDKDYEYIQGEA